MYQQRQAVSMVESARRPRSGNAFFSRVGQLKFKQSRCFETPGEPYGSLTVSANPAKALATNIRRKQRYPTDHPDKRASYEVREFNMDVCRNMDEILDYREMFHPSTLKRFGIEPLAPKQAEAKPGRKPPTPRRKQKPMTERQHRKHRPSPQECRRWLERYHVAMFGMGHVGKKKETRA